MTLIDRYMLGLFLKILFVAFASLTGVFLVVMAFGSLDDLQQVAARDGWLRTIVQFYGVQVLTFFDQTSGLLALAATMFTIAWMRSKNEATAMMAGGIAIRRIIMPLLAGSVALSLLAVVNREWLIPTFRDRLAVKAKNYLAPQRLRPRYDHLTDVLIGGRETLAAEQRIVDASFGMPPGMQQFGRRINGPAAAYTPQQGERPAGYLLSRVEQPENIDQLPSAYLDSKPVVLTAKDTPWLEPGQCFVATDVSFNQLAADPAWRRFASTRQLIDELHNPSLDYGAAEMVRIHARIVRPILDVVLLFLGLPFVIAREQKGLFVVAGGCFLIVSGFYLVTLAAHAMGAGYFISPALAAWFPILVFGPFAYALSEPLWE